MGGGAVLGRGVGVGAVGRGRAGHADLAGVGVGGAPGGRLVGGEVSRTSHGVGVASGGERVVVVDVVVLSLSGRGWGRWS